MDFLAAINNYSGQPLTRQILMDILQDYKRPYDKINELTRQGFLIPVKRGVFIAGPKLFAQPPENMLLANHLWGPSYVSSDSALAYWGLIPERVYETVSMTTNVAKTYITPVGSFRYIRLSVPYYSYGMKRVELASKQMALVAGKEKALCDKIITTSGLQLRSKSQTRDYLTNDLRISREQLRELNISLIEDYIAEAPKRDSIEVLIKTLVDL